SPGSAVARNIHGGRDAAIRFSAYRLFPDRAPPSTSVSWGMVDPITALCVASIAPWIPLTITLTNDMPRPLSGGDRRSLGREITGNAVRKPDQRGASNAAAAPATVSGEPIPQSHWETREGGAGR